MRVRAYEPSDAAPLSELYVLSVRLLGPRDYSVQQVEAWAALAPSPDRLQTLSEDGRVRLVVVDATEQPVAFADLEHDGHIDLFYCAPEAAGSGAASALYDALEAAARERGVTRLYVEASEAARRLFLRRGFVETARREFEVSGVPIHNYAMEKQLGGQGRS